MQLARKGISSGRVAVGAMHPCEPTFPTRTTSHLTEAPAWGTCEQMVFRIPPGSEDLPFEHFLATTRFVGVPSPYTGILLCLSSRYRSTGTAKATATLRSQKISQDMTKPCETYGKACDSPGKPSVSGTVMFVIELC